MRLSEVFDSKVSYDLTFKEKEAQGSFEIEESWIEVNFFRKKTGIWLIEFKDMNVVGDGFDLSNKGNAVKIFSTVFAIIKEFIKKVDPDAIAFSAKEKNRRKLYKALIKKLAPVAKMSLARTDIVKDYASGTEYEDYVLVKNVEDKPVTGRKKRK